MSTTAQIPLSTHAAWHLGWTGRVVAAWAVAGAVAGGLLVTGLLLAGRVRPESILILTAILAAGGGALGLLHGTILGYLGRPAEPEARTTLGDIALASLLGIGAYALGVALALWLTLVAVMARAGSPVAWAILALATAGCLALLVWASFLGWHVMENAYARWPEHRLGSWLVGGTFVTIAALFLALRPAVPVLQVRLSAGAFLVVAALATLWIAAPVVFVALRLAHRRARE
jgi:hypothetical protein